MVCFSEKVQFWKEKWLHQPISPSSFPLLYTISLFPCLTLPVHPPHPLTPPSIPPIAFLSYRKSKRLTCKWGLLNPIRPSVTSQQREGECRDGGVGGGCGRNYDLSEEKQSEIHRECGKRELAASSLLLQIAPTFQDLTHHVKSRWRIIPTGCRKKSTALRSGLNVLELEFRLLQVQVLVSERRVWRLKAALAERNDGTASRDR